MLLTQPIAYKVLWRFLLAVLDASSKLQSGILKGNVRDYGNFKECLESVGTYGNETIRGKYCLARVITSMQFVCNVEHS